MKCPLKTPMYGLFIQRSGSYYTLVFIVGCHLLHMHHVMLMVYVVHVAVRDKPV